MLKGRPLEDVNVGAPKKKTEAVGRGSEMRLENGGEGWEN